MTAKLNILDLKHLKLITDNIAVKTDSFSKDSFFKNGPVKLRFKDNFNKLILETIPKTVPAFEGVLRKTQLKESMYDSEILGELGHPQPLIVSEFAAIIRELLLKQPDGEDGFLNNGYANVLHSVCYANVFYVKLEDESVVAVGVFWFPGVHDWMLDVSGLNLDGGRWNVGGCVFSRS